MKNVAIFGVPRSGTSWLGQIFNSSEFVAYRYQPIFAYSFPYSIGENSNEKNIEKFHSKLLVTEDPFVCQKKNISGNETPNFDKKEITHLVWKEVRYLDMIENLLSNSDIKIVGIIRHPCGVIKSWMIAPKEFDNDWDITEEWRLAEKKNKTVHDYYGFMKWLEATELILQLRQRFPERISLVTYENLLRNAKSEIMRLFDFCGLSFTDQVEMFLEKSTSTSSNDPYDIYRINKKTDEWKGVLSSGIVEEILNDERFIKIKSRLKWI